MKIQHAYRQVPKPGSNAEQCEDAFDFSAKTLTFAVSDGASTAFESRLWARLLAENFAAAPPLKWDGDQFLGWTDQVAAEWNKSIPWHDLDVFEERKASGGSAATLVGLLLGPYVKAANAHVWRCLAIGDSCLFQVRHGKLVAKLPVARSTDFGLHPALLSTEGNANAANLGRLEVQKGTWRSGDMFFLLTDAIAHWFLSQHEAGGAPWEFLASSGPSEFETFVRDGQSRGLIRKDDVTVFMLGVDVQVGIPDETVPIPVPPGPRPGDDTAPEDRVVSGPGPRVLDRPADVTQPRPQPGSAPQTKPRRTPAPPPRPPQPQPQSRPQPQGGGTRPRPARRITRPQAGWVVAAVLAVCLAVVFPIALSSGSGSPSARVPATTSPPASPSSSPPPVQTDQDAVGKFAETLVSFPRAGVSSPPDYESALVKDEASGTPGLTALLSQLMPPSAGLESFSMTPSSVAVAPSSTASRAEVYVVVGQRTKVRGHKASYGTFLIDLTLARGGKGWQLSGAQIWSMNTVEAPASGGKKK